MKNNIKKLIVVLLVTCNLNVFAQNKITKNHYTTIDNIFNINLGMSPEEVSATLAIKPYDIHQNLALNQLIVEYKYVHKFHKDKADEVFVESSRNDGELYYEGEASIYMVFDNNRLLISYFTNEGMAKAQDAYVWENTLMLLNSKVDCGSCIKLQKVKKKSTIKVESKKESKSKVKKPSSAQQKQKEAKDKQAQQKQKEAKDKQAQQKQKEANDKQAQQKQKEANDKQAQQKQKEAKDEQAQQKEAKDKQSAKVKEAKDKRAAKDKEAKDKLAAKDKEAKDKQDAKDKKAKDKQAAKDKKAKDKQAAKDKKAKDKQAAKDKKTNRK